ncbi:MAG TPA: glycosyltransferase [Bacteroidales bacterium]
MLSICIPIYNFDVTGLVVILHQQAIRQNIPAEVICIDDASDIEFRVKNKDICNTYGKYIQLNENIGRAKIRNLFLDYAQYDYLLFLDCDSVLITSDFVKKYAEAIIHGGNKVICGGRIYNEIRPSKQKMLRWRYGRKKESIPVTVRQQNPHVSFITSNFTVHKEILSQIKFDERLVKYGHEDTLFGFQLKKNHIPVQHIDNPILNGYLEDNEEFIEKTELGLSNLVCILQFLNRDRDFINDVTLLKFHKKCRRFGLNFLIAFLFSMLKPMLRLNLVKGYSNLFWFDFYKLGFFSKAYLTCYNK